MLLEFCKQYANTKIAVPVVLLGFLALLLGYFRRIGVGTRLNVPGPPAFPVLGTTWLFLVGKYELSKLHEYYKAMHQQYGPIVKEEAFMNIPVYNIFEKEDIEKVLKEPSKYPMRPPTEAIAIYRYSRPERYASAGLVNEQGEKWRHLRTTLTPNLTSPKTISNFSDKAHILAEDWCRYLKEHKNHNNLVNDLGSLAIGLCIETTCHLVLGQRLGFLESSVPEKAVILSKALHRHFNALRDTQFSLPLWKYIPTEMYNVVVESEDLIYDTVADLIGDYKNECGHEDNVYYSIMKSEIDVREKTAAIIDFIAAGIHTLKNSLVFLLYLVAKNRHVQEKVINDLKYAKACVLESFRLLPTATPLARVLQEDMNLSGFTIGAGNVVLCHNSIACRKKENFEKPDEYIPERWLSERGVEDHATGGMLLVAPFGSGRRICPGKRFIELVLPIFLQTVVRNFEMETDHVMELQFQFLMAPKGDVSIVFKNRC